MPEARRQRRPVAALLRPVAVWLLIAGLTVAPHAQQTAPASSSARVWLGRHQDIEAYLRTAPVERIEEVPIGVTKPKRIFFEPGGPVASAAWKPIRPGRYKGYWESYKAEIAAYEMDRLLGLDMVPVSVERRVGRERGAAILWVENVRMWRDAKDDEREASIRWTRQVAKMRMFDNLVHNNDRNLGNLLVDEAWNLVLIDHSRAFWTDRRLVVPMSSIDRDLWERMRALDADTLAQALGRWLSGGERRAILRRRDLMAATIEEMVLQRGEAVFLPAADEPAIAQEPHSR